MSMRIDFHTHIIPPPGVMPDWSAALGAGRWPSLTADGDDGLATLRLGEQVMMRIDERFWSPERRIVDMDRQGVDVQVLSPIPLLSGYMAPAEGNQQVARFLNEHIAGIVARIPGRFAGMGTVPLQSPDLAIAELRFLNETAEIRAVQIGTCPAGLDLDNPILFPFFEACQDLDFPVFVHPMQPLVGGDRLSSYYLPNIAGNPLELGLAMTKLIVGGVLERLPKLRICFAHGGGAFPAILGRVDKGFAVRSEMKVNIDRPPSDYLSRLYVDSLTFDPDTLKLAIGKIGPERVILGSDYPFGLSDPDPVKTIEGAGLPAATVKGILEDNIWDYLGHKP